MSHICRLGPPQWGRIPVQYLRGVSRFLRPMDCQRFLHHWALRAQQTPRDCITSRGTSTRAIKSRRMSQRGLRRTQGILAGTALAVGRANQVQALFQNPSLPAVAHTHRHACRFLLAPSPLLQNFTGHIFLRGRNLVACKFTVKFRIIRTHRVFGAPFFVLCVQFFSGLFAFKDTGLEKHFFPLRTRARGPSHESLLLHTTGPNLCASLCSTRPHSSRTEQSK